MPSDHHYSNFTYADINWINPQASAVGEMVFELGERLGAPMGPEIAENLYCAIVSDTGSFQFSNTTARAFETCYKLAALGASPIRVSERLYANNPPEKIILLGQVLSTLRMSARGNIASITMFRKHLSDLHLKEIDTEDITTLARSIKGVEMVLFFKEMDRDVFRVSLRSKGSANAAKVAEHFGGGGHVHASGIHRHRALRPAYRGDPPDRRGPAPGRRGRGPALLIPPEDPLDGLIVVDKPRGPTSHDVVARVRRILGGVKAGHCGTLDPDASGVLLVAVGRAARLFPFLSGHDKAYAGAIRFGFATDTYDAAGRPTTPVSDDLPGETALRTAMGRFEGRIRQAPPAYSALKQDGQPLYKLARANREVRVEPREVTVHRFVLSAWAPPLAQFDVECSAGTYVRSLAHDLRAGARLRRPSRLAPPDGERAVRPVRRPDHGRHGLPRPLGAAGPVPRSHGGPSPGAAGPRSRSRRGRTRPARQSDRPRTPPPAR